MQQIVITGATGFVGSALAASLLSRNTKVIALSRNDPDGARTVAAIAAAAQGFGFDVSGAVCRHLNVINVEFGRLEKDLECADLSGVTDVWHVAAEMSSSPHKLSQAFNANVGNTVRLYEAMQRQATTCRRFYYVSTAYVAGMAGGPVPEELHAASHMVNAYQITKWSAEQALHLLYRRHRLPVTVFRPSVVVGHRQTGWAHRNGFGFYMFLEGMMAIAKAGLSELAVGVVPDTRPDLVSIDQLVTDACLLTERKDSGQDFEVFHCGGGLLVRASELVKILGEAVGLQSRLGAPVTALEQRFERAVEPNMPFAENEWAFDRSKLDAATNRTTPAPLSVEDLRKLCRWYVAVSASELSVAVS